MQRALRLKLDFPAAEKAFEKLEAVKPFVEQLDETQRGLLWAELGSIGLSAGEAAAALEGCKKMLGSGARRFGGRKNQAQPARKITAA